VASVDHHHADVSVVDQRVREGHPGRAGAHHQIVGFQLCRHSSMLFLAPPRVNGTDGPCSGAHSALDGRRRTRHRSHDHTSLVATMVTPRDHRSIVLPPRPAVDGTRAGSALPGSSEEDYRPKMTAEDRPLRSSRSPLQRVAGPADQQADEPLQVPPHAPRPEVADEPLRKERLSAGGQVVSG
jgi:hypothetical protein